MIELMELILDSRESRLGMRTDTAEERNQFFEFYQFYQVIQFYLQLASIELIPAMSRINSINSGVPQTGHNLWPYVGVFICGGYWVWAFLCLCD